MIFLVAANQVVNCSILMQRAQNQDQQIEPSRGPQRGPRRTKGSCDWTLHCVCMPVSHPAAQGAPGSSSIFSRAATPLSAACPPTWKEPSPWRCQDTAHIAPHPHHLYTIHICMQVFCVDPRSVTALHCTLHCILHYALNVVLPVTYTTSPTHLTVHWTTNTCISPPPSPCQAPPVVAVGLPRGPHV